MFAERCVEVAVRYGVDISIRRVELIEDMFAVCITVKKGRERVHAYVLPKDFVNNRHDAALDCELEKIVTSLWKFERG